MEDLAVMQEADDDGGRQTGILDNTSPFDQTLIGRDDGGPPFVAVGTVRNLCHYPLEVTLHALALTADGATFNAIVDEQPIETGTR